MSEQGFIYFVQEERHENPAEDFIKIGHSRSVDMRLSILNPLSPFKLRVAATFPGTQDMERRLHHLFATSRLNGEWFRQCNGIRDIIKTGVLPELPSIVKQSVKAKRGRFTIEIYEEEEILLRRMKSHSFDTGVPFRDFVVKAIDEKLEREGALPDKKKK